MCWQVRRLGIAIALVSIVSIGACGKQTPDEPPMPVGVTVLVANDSTMVGIPGVTVTFAAANPAYGTASCVTGDSGHCTVGLAAEEMLWTVTVVKNSINAGSRAYVGGNGDTYTFLTHAFS